MTIKYTPRNNKKTIEVEGYGKFTVRPYGAGEELQIQANMRELNEIQVEAQNILERYKNADRNAPLNPDDKKTLAELQSKVDELTVETHEILKSTITSETEGAVDRLFKELDRTEIRRIIDAALLGEVANEPKEPNASV